MTPSILEGISGGVHYAGLGEPLEDQVADAMPRNKTWQTASRRSVGGASRPPRLSGAHPLCAAPRRGVPTQHDQTASQTGRSIDALAPKKQALRAFRSNWLIPARRAARRSLPTLDTPGRSDQRVHINTRGIDVGCDHRSEDMNIRCKN
jgi:hypothetical protein